MSVDLRYKEALEEQVCHYEQYQGVSKDKNLGKLVLDTAMERWAKEIKPFFDPSSAVPLKPVVQLARKAR
jgi:hypothetical protein